MKRVNALLLIGIVGFVIVAGNAAALQSASDRFAPLFPGDSGIYIRGVSKSQINIWNWPVGSGEIWGYRTDKNMPAEVRRAVTPVLNADNPVGQWNRFEITAIDDEVTIAVNGKTVIRKAQLPGIPKRGAIALQHHGDPPAQSVRRAGHIQFANIYIKELD
jgi:hypothetical protein